jgi:anti-anti-sigma factor
VEIGTRIINGVTVVDIFGRLSTKTSGSATDELNRIAGESENVLLNLEGMEFLSSAGLRVILRLAKVVNGSAFALKVSGARGMVKEVLEISGFKDLIDIYEEESEALEAY